MLWKWQSRLIYEQFRTVDRLHDPEQVNDITGNKGRMPASVRAIPGKEKHRQRKHTRRQSEHSGNSGDRPHQGNFKNAELKCLPHLDADTHHQQGDET